MKNPDKQNPKPKKPSILTGLPIRLDFLEWYETKWKDDLSSQGWRKNLADKHLKVLSGETNSLFLIKNS